MCSSDERRPGDAPLINVFGGKITTYRRLAESMLKRSRRRSASAVRPGRGEPLPGGDFEVTEFDELADRICERHPYLGRSLVHRLARLYGTDAYVILDAARSLRDLGRDFGHGLHEAEVRFLMEYEWATTAEDVLFRRTRLGIRMNAAERQALSEWMDDRRAAA